MQSYKEIPSWQYRSSATWLVRGKTVDEGTQGTDLGVLHLHVQYPCLKAMIRKVQIARGGDGRNQFMTCKTTLDRAEVWTVSSIHCNQGHDSQGCGQRLQAFSAPRQMGHGHHCSLDIVVSASPSAPRPLRLHNGPGTLVEEMMVWKDDESLKRMKIVVESRASLAAKERSCILR